MRCIYCDNVKQLKGLKKCALFVASVSNLVENRVLE